MAVAVKSAAPVGALPAPTGRRRASRRAVRTGLLVLPAVLFLGIFFGYPVVVILGRGFTSVLPPDHGTFANFSWVLGTHINFVVLLRTVEIALMVTAVCLVVAFPYAYLCTISGPLVRAILLGIVAVTAIMSLLVRSYAWLILLESGGPVSSALHTVGLGSGTLAGTTGGVVMAMSEILAPLAILPLYATMTGIDRRLTKAARSLGAGPVATFFRVYMPLTLPGMLAGGLLVFVITLGFYVTPQIVGSEQNSVVSQLIVGQINYLLAWGHAGALSMFLLLLTVIALFFVARIIRRRPEQLVQSAAGISGRRERASDVSPAFRATMGVLSAITALWLIAPIFVIVPLSFTGKMSFAFPPHTWSTRWYSSFFDTSVWTSSLWLSVKVAIATTVLSVTLATAAVIGLTRGRLRGKQAVSVFLLMPMLVPAVITAVGIYAVFLRWKLVGSFNAFVIADTVMAIPFVFVPVYSAFQTLDPQLDHAAAGLGAGVWARLWCVTRPLVLPGILAGALYAFVVSFDETVISVFIASPTSKTLPVQLYQTLIGSTDPTVAAAATIVMVVSLVALGAGQLLRRRIRYVA
jgi:putative spermidine/putrescine transport system permease protein